MLGKRLKKARESNNLSQADVAKELNISRQSISKWENDRVSPDLDNLIRLSTLYNISLDDLLKDNYVNTDDEKMSGICNRNQEFKTESEWIMLMILCVLSTLAAPLGLISAPLIILRNRKNKMYHKLIIIGCIVCILVNIYHIYMILGDYHHSEQVIEIKKMN